MDGNSSKRTYKSWTAEEVEILRKGQVPSGRSYISAKVKVIQLGIDWEQWKVAHQSYRKNGWTADDIKSLRAGVFPLSHSVSSCYIKCKKLGIEARPQCTPDAVAELEAGRIPRGWRYEHALAEMERMGVQMADRQDGEPTPDEVRALENHTVPEGWSISRARYESFKRGLSFQPVAIKLYGSRDRKVEEMYVLWAMGRSSGYIAGLYGLSRQRVDILVKDYIKENGISVPGEESRL